MRTKCKILLINPPYVSYGEDVDVHAEEPLGLLYLAAYLRENNKDVEILDGYQGKPSVYVSDGFFRSGLSNDEIERKIEESSPDIVGITSMFSLYSKGAQDVAQLTKRVSKDILVVFGGIHPSSFPDIVLSDKNVDLIVMGEGEETLLEIVERFEVKKPLTGIHGTAYEHNGKVLFHPRRALIQDIDNLPLPARDLLDMNIYLSDIWRSKFSMAPPRLNVVTSRGCPFNCVYCAIHAVWCNSYRTHSPERVGEELEYLIRNYGIKEVAFMDDNLTFNNDRMFDICNEIIRRKLNLRWCTPNGVAIWTLEKPLLDKMRESGCYKLTFGIETGSQKTQKFVRKSYIDLEKSKEVIKYCNKIGLWTHAAFIIGFVNETREDIEDTIKYAVSTDLDMATFFIATPFPGTDLYSIYQEEGLISKVDNAADFRWNSHQWRIMCDTKFFTKDELAKIVREAYRRFYISRVPKFLNPIRLLRKGSGFDELKFFLKLVKSYKSTVDHLIAKPSSGNRS